MSVRITLTITAGSLRGKRYVFHQPMRCLIGRGSDCDIRLPGDWEFLNISRQHCLLDIAPPSVRVRDCGSRNGTRLNGIFLLPPDWLHEEDETELPSPESVELVDGDELQIGSLTLLLNIYQSVPCSHCGTETFPDDDQEALCQECQSQRSFAGRLLAGQFP